MHITGTIRVFCTAILVVVQNAMSASDDCPDIWIGKSGGELVRAIADTHTPLQYFNRFDGEGGIFEILKITDGNQDGTAYVNHFSHEHIQFGKNGGAPENLELLNIASPKWWKITSPNCKNVGMDLLGMIPAPSGTAATIGDCAPGTVTEFEIQNGIWGVGSGNVGLQKIRLWEPPEELKGDIARILMYMACIYSSGLMRYETCGGAIWSDNPEEGFTGAYGAQLMVWHKADPISHYEIQRNLLFGKLQGNSNPFVEYPELAEFLWGNRKGEGYKPSEEHMSTLRAVYSMDDPLIHLRLDLVPDDAVWKFDGQNVTEKYLVPAEIGVGIHELYFYSSSFNGMIKIEVK